MQYFGLETKVQMDIFSPFDIFATYVIIFNFKQIFVDIRNNHKWFVSAREHKLPFLCIPKVVGQVLL